MEKENGFEMSEIKTATAVKPEEYAEVKVKALPSDNPSASVGVAERMGFDIDIKSGIYPMKNPDTLMDSTLITPTNMVFESGITLKEAVKKSDDLKHAYWEGKGFSTNAAEIQAMAISEAAKLGIIFNTAPSLSGKEKELIAGVKENLLGLAYWVADKVDNVRERWEILPRRQKTAIKITTTLVSGIMALSACTPRDTGTVTVEPSTALPPTVEVSPTPFTTATATETQIPTATETVTPTEDLRFPELIPASKELVKTQNVIRFGHEEEDWALVAQKEDELLKTLDVTSGVKYYSGVNKSGTGSGVDADILEFKSKVISVVFQELNDKHEGVFVFGIPFVSPYDNEPHVYHGAIDWDNFNEIVENIYGENAKSKSHLDYSFLTSGNYKTILFSFILDFTGNADHPLSGNPLFHKLEQIWSHDKAGASVWAGMPNVDEPTMKIIDESIIPGDYIWFE